MTNEMTKDFLDQCKKAQEDNQNAASTADYVAPGISRLDTDAILEHGGGNPGTASSAAGLALSAVA